MAIRGDKRQGADLPALRHDEGVRFDPDRLLALYAELGPAGAENIVTRAIEELALRLADLELHAAGGNLAEVGIASDMLGRVADQIGMTTLSRVSGDVATSARRADRVALAATLARLVRIGDRSLAAIWDLSGSDT